MTRRSLTLLFVAVGLASCAPNDGDVGIDGDYVLASTAQALATTGPVLLRYEDQWVPLTCDGRTYRDDDLVTIRIAWTCRYRDLNGDVLRTDAAWEGALRDEDGDGTFTGNLFVVPLDANRSDVDANAANVFPFTMTPVAN